MEYILKKLSKLNEEISGVPIVCSYFGENNIETPPTSARNKKSTNINNTNKKYTCNNRNKINKRNTKNS